MRDSDRAISDFRQMVRIDPNNKENHTFLIQALFNARRFNEVIDGEFTIDIFPHPPQAEDLVPP